MQKLDPQGRGWVQTAKLLRALRAVIASSEGGAKPAGGGNEGGGRGGRKSGWIGSLGAVCHLIEAVRRRALVMRAAGTCTH